MAKINQPKVSIIIPTYNQKTEYLKESIESAIEQAYENIEIIVVDDGSVHNEETKQLCDCYVADKKIILITQKNKGIAGALNTGIKNMTGEWFAWLSSDDKWYPGKLWEQMKFIEEISMKTEDAKVFYSDWEYMDANGNVVTKVNEPVFKNQKDMQFHLCHSFFGCGSCILIHKSCFDEVGMFDESLKKGFEDYEMWFRLAKRYMFHKVPKVLMKYRSHPGALRYDKNVNWQQNWEIKCKGRTLLGYYDDSLVSVIVPAYNVENTISDCLAGIIADNPRVGEVIVINDGSTDRTKEILQKHPLAKTTVITNEKCMGRAITRNKGFKVAKYPFIATVDGDIIPDKGWLNLLLEQMDKRWVDVMAGSVRWKSDNMGMWGEYYDFIQTQNAKRWIGTAMTLFKKEVLEGIGFLDESMTSGEDSEMFTRFQDKGYRFMKIPTLIGTHIEERNLFELLSRHYEYGRDRAIISMKHPDKMKGQFSENEVVVNPQEIMGLIDNLLKLIGSLGFRETYQRIKNGGV